MGQEPQKQTPREEISLDVRGAKIRISLSLPPDDNNQSKPEEVRMAEALDILLFDPLEQRALRLLCAEPTLSRLEMSDRLKVAPDSQLKEQLTRLVRCRVLVSSANGYSLRCPAGTPWQDRARQILAYLDSLPSAQE